MQTSRPFVPRTLWGIIAGTIALALVITASAHAQTLNTLYTFAGGAGGANPAGHLVFDANGNLYGVAFGGLGTAKDGAAYEITP